MNIIFELQRNPFRKASPKLIDYFPLFIDSVLFDRENRAICRYLFSSTALIATFAPSLKRNKTNGNNEKLQLLLVSIAMLSMFSCSDDDDDTLGVWYRRSDFDGRAREDAAGFVIDNRGYLCGGYRGKDQRERDCWEYNIDNDWWTQCADLPEEAAARNGAVGFAINSKGYVTTGYTVYRDDDPLHTGGYAYLKDTWEYEPATDTWKQMDDYPGDARINAIAFAIGNYGYVGTGQSKDDKQTKDFYRFDPTAASGNQWTIVNGFGGQKRTGGLSFIIDNVAYIVGGTNNGKDVDDFWKFDPSKSEENKWVRLRDITDQSSDDYDDDYKSITRTYGCAFVIDDQAYITLGQTASGSFRSNYWIYYPAKDLWRSSETEDDFDYTSFEGSSRIKAVCFSTGRRGIVTTGGSSSYYYDDTWELHPYEWEEND